MGRLYVWLHTGLVHLLGNMLFLWVFGNAVCSKLGSLWYAVTYVGLGVISGITHLLFDSAPAVGASGAINGIVGLFLIFYPLNGVRCLLLLLYRPITFEVSSYWVILMWFFFDVLGAVRGGGGGVAYYAHIGGLVSGAVLGVLLLKTGLVSMEEGEKSLPMALSGRKRRVADYSDVEPPEIWPPRDL